MAAGVEDEPALAGVPQASGGGADAIGGEPALAGAPQASGVGADAIGGEAALAGVPEAVRDKARMDAVLRGKWEAPARKGVELSLLGLYAASGLFALICTFAKGALGFGLFAVAAGAPVVEEMAKVVLTLMLLEKEPWRFRSAGAIVLSCLVSALVFATVENMLYLNVYIPENKLTAGIIWYRLTVCTMLHLCCTAISSCGLAKAWRNARECLRTFSASTVTPYLVVAMVVHGLYNTFAVLFSLAQ